MNGPKYLLDTNIVLGLFRGEQWSFSFFERARREGASLSVSVVTRMELLSFPEISKEEVTAVRELLSLVQILPLDRATEDLAIALRRRQRFKLPDAIIAATAIASAHRLVSTDQDFSRENALDLLDPRSSDLLAEGR
jgi:predicted nucleic acid-binding protein